MKTGVILRDPDAAPPQFYAPGASSRALAPAQSWSEDPAQALCFASEKDARDFAETFLPHLAPAIIYTPYTDPA